jgi:hypothetical protein
MHKEYLCEPSTDSHGTLSEQVNGYSAELLQTQGEDQKNGGKQGKGKSNGEKPATSICQKHFCLCIGT